MQHRRKVVDLIDEEDVTLLEVIGIIAKSYHNGFKYCSPVRGLKRGNDSVDVETMMRTSVIHFLMNDDVHFIVGKSMSSYRSYSYSLANSFTHSS